MDDELRKEYERNLSLLAFEEADSDYMLLERQHKPMLSMLAQVSGSVITVFDIRARKHVFASGNFFDLFGQDADIEGMHEKIHPDDLQLLIRNAITAIKHAVCRKNIRDYKFICEYRIGNASGEYVRVIEQQSILEMDKSGNARLALSVLDLSPDQSAFKQVKGCVLSLKNNMLLSLRELSGNENVVLSPRETEILQMVGNGLPSKEISERLFISVHTVNTHRQRILEKLGACNSMEAVKYASALGLLV
ncbi:MAG: LuxR C-terminal-related transcriptional regulator [Prevotellaceae bacterium]|jgi:DNA-binding CsgD family transcriptional regulator|nr:LuxR C-terminal-related transcriptional regulator [Prevotellaceae bacterium]